MMILKREWESLRNKNKGKYPQNLLQMLWIDCDLDDEQMERLNEAIGQETEIRQKTIRMYFKEHKSIGEIQKIEKVSYPCIRQRLVSGLMHIKWKREYILYANPDPDAYWKSRIWESE